jgi:excisionase family DNA binding protein
MLLSVNQAARRLGVSPVTVRRWTATGLLPCTRTAGGHRRIDEHDLDDLASSIGAGSQLAAQAAREREVEVLVETSIALAGRLELGELLEEIAMRMTGLLDCHFCAISEYDAAGESVATLAEYDDAGRRLPDQSPYRLRDFPLTRRVLEVQVTAVVNVDDPEADAAEVAELRREGDRSLLMVPLVVHGDTIGLLEVVDQERSRQYTRQELRLASAVAGQAAIAIRNAKLFAEGRAGEGDAERLGAALRALSMHVTTLAEAGHRQDLLARLATAVREAFEAVSCVVETGGLSAGASGADHAGLREATLTVARAPSERGDLSLTLTTPAPLGGAGAALLDLVVAAAAERLSRLPDPHGPSCI